MKKSIILASLTGLLMISLLAYYFVTNEKASSTQVNKITFLKSEKYVLQKKTMPLKIVALGDSLTQGVGDKSHLGYAGDTANLLKKVPLYSSVSLKNYGVRGYTTDALLRVLKRKEVLSNIQQSQMIFLTIGGNDLLNVLKKHFLNLKVSDFNQPRKHYQINLNTILTILEKNNPRATIYYLGLYNPFQDYFDNLDQFNQIIEQWNSVSKTVLSKYPHTHYISTFDLFAGQSKTLFSQDHLHPNSDGYHLMSNRLFQYIKKK